MSSSFLSYNNYSQYYERFHLLYGASVAIITHKTFHCTAISIFVFSLFECIKFIIHSASQVIQEIMRTNYISLKKSCKPITSHPRDHVNHSAVYVFCQHWMCSMQSSYYRSILKSLCWLSVVYHINFKCFVWFILQFHWANCILFYI